LKVYRWTEVRGVHMRLVTKLVILTDSRKRMALLTLLTFVSLC